MSIIKIIGISIMISVILSSCFTTKPTATRNVLQSYIGHSENNVIKEFGPPTRVTSDGSSGKILIYESTRHGTMHMPGLKGDSPYYPMFSASASHTSYIQFFVNENSQIYHWRTNYPETKQVYDPKKTTWAVLGWIAGTGLFTLLLVWSWGPY